MTSSPGTIPPQSFPLSVSFFPGNRALRSEDLPRSRGIARSGLRPLTKIPYCCLPQESGPSLSPSVAVRPLRPAMHHCLGGPLPRQPANAPQVHPHAELLFLLPGQDASARPIGYQLPFPEVLPIARAGSLRVTHPFATDIRKCPFDLHVLGMPPAFILSQDQTLHLIRLFFLFLFGFCCFFLLRCSQEIDVILSSFLFSRTCTVLLFLPVRFSKIVRASLSAHSYYLILFFLSTLFILFFEYF